MLKDYTILSNGEKVDNSIVNYFLSEQQGIVICSSYQNARTAKKAFNSKGLKVLRFGNIYVVATKAKADLIILDWKTLLFKQNGVFIN